MKSLILKLLARYRELIVYCLIGCTGAGLDFLIYALLTTFTGLHYQLANFISVSCGVFDSFILNYFFNFNVKNRFWLRFASFYGICMIGCVVQMGCLWLLIDRLGCHKLISKLVAVAVITVLQFTLNKLITFRKGK